MDCLLVAEGHTDRGDVTEAVTKIQQQVRSTRGAFEDFFGEYFNPSHLLIVEHEVVDAEESVIKLKIDHDGKTADRSRIGKTLKRPSMQFGARLTHVRLLSLYTAQSTDFGQKLLQVRIVKFQQ